MENSVRQAPVPACCGWHRRAPKRKTGRKELLILEFFVFFSESFDTAGRIHEFLFAGKKRMTFGTNFDADVFFRGSDLYGVAAGTLHGRVEIIRMDVSFHCYFNPL
jgi:hypothetical protein